MIWLMTALVLIQVMVVWTWADEPRNRGLKDVAEGVMSGRGGHDLAGTLVALRLLPFACCANNLHSKTVGNWDARRVSIVGSYEWFVLDGTETKYALSEETTYK